MPKVTQLEFESRLPGLSVCPHIHPQGEGEFAVLGRTHVAVQCAPQESRSSAHMDTCAYGGVAAEKWAARG